MTWCSRCSCGHKIIRDHVISQKLKNADIWNLACKCSLIQRCWWCVFMLYRSIASIEWVETLWRWTDETLGEFYYWSLVWVVTTGKCGVVMHSVTSACLSVCVCACVCVCSSCLCSNFSKPWPANFNLRTGSISWPEFVKGVLNQGLDFLLCHRYMWNKIISKLFQSPLMSQPK